MTMQLSLNWLDALSVPSQPAQPSPSSLASVAQAGGAAHLLQLPPAVEAAVWRATELGQAATSVVGSGWEALDAELPGGGWPLRSVTEVLATQPSVLEWRLLSPALRSVVAGGGQVVVVGPGRNPHLPGLRHEGLDERQLVWIRAEAPSERMWVTEQLIRSNSAGAIVAWLPQARQEQLRRLQVAALACEGLVFLCRPTAARHEASASPLRVHASVGLDWELKVNVFKRRGPVHEDELLLPSVPGGLSSVLTPRLRKPSRLVSRGVTADVVGSPSSFATSRRHATVQ
ncbi:translesion DNA synthesis-associated protein ImuA [Scleromatobacter humisilvae]|uniref:Translesion DNA synthesis-associated protein ImuA n=1 Tax=Scleromatobacter humisilvae TaxID=2897159 RepID=A0A9X2C039_9BURK|nr:translesion DNA synthesis-associated protein ImuA [Scleromatobacter humisilvae]MCK9687318.1 translesion DNA synthesis-associated protein ImuA [Scleromatobacter humisilvae]